MKSYGKDQERDIMQQPSRLDRLLRNPVRTLEKAEADAAELIGIEMTVRVKGVEEVTEQLAELCELVLKAQAIAEGLNESLRRLEIEIS